MQLERYRIESEIGRGAMATVYRAYDTRAERTVALKLLHRRFLSDEAIRARFIQEAKTVSQMRHRAIVPILHAAQVGEDIFLVMPLMPGGSLADRLQRGPLPIAETLDVLERIASALDYAHTKGVIHRDVKPDNILFDESGHAYLADFGVIKLAESRLTLTGVGLIGTPAYMSPEQVRGAKQLDGRSDIYGLGVVLFEMLAGRVPYDGESEMDVAMKHISAPIPNIRSFMGALSPGWQKVINRAMAKKPEERFQTGDELMTAVRQLAAKQPAVVDRRLPLALGGLALLLLVGAGMYFAGRAVAGRGSATNGVATVTAEVTSVAAVDPTQSPPTGAPPTEDAPATGTASATPAATPIPAQAAVLYTDDGPVPLTLGDDIPVQDDPLVMQIDSTNGELEPMSLVGAARSQVELAAVDGTNHRVSLRLGPGSDVFVHTGGYTGEIVTLGGRQGVIQAEPGACLSITVPADETVDPMMLACHAGECRYRMGSGAQEQLAPGDIIQFVPGDAARWLGPIPREQTAAYGALVLPSVDGERIGGLCGLTGGATPTTTRTAATAVAGTSTWTPTPILATAVPTSASDPATATIAPGKPTNTVERPTPTPPILPSPPPTNTPTSRPTNTSTRPPTDTPRPPTNTPQPAPTDTSRPPTNTPQPPTEPPPPTSTSEPSTREATSTAQSATRTARP